MNSQILVLFQTLSWLWRFFMHIKLTPSHHRPSSRDKTHVKQTKKNGTKCVYILTWIAVLCADGLLQRQWERGQLHSHPSTRPPRPGHLLHALLFLASGDCSLLLLTGGEDTDTHTHIKTSAHQIKACKVVKELNTHTHFYVFVHTKTYPASYMTHHPEIKDYHTKKRLTDARLLFTKAPINNSRPNCNGCLMLRKQTERCL